MGDEDQRAVILLDGALDPFAGSNIEVVGRLVEDEQIDLLVHQHAQAKAGLLAAGERPDGLEHVLAGEEKGAEAVSGLLRGAVFLVQHGVVERAFGVVEVHDLGQIGRLDRRAETDAPGIHRLLAQQAAQEGRLAGAVVTQDGDPLPALDQKLHAGEQLPFPVALGHILDRKNHIPEEFLFPEAGLERLLGLGPLGLADALQTVLHRHRAAVEDAVVDAPALHPLNREGKLLDLSLLLLILLELEVEAGLLFLQIEGIVSVVVLGMTVGDLDDPVHDPVQEEAVMGDRQRGPLELLDIGLQPLDAAQVQVVGRLVEQKDVGLLQQEPGEIHAGLFAAGELGKELIAHGGGDAQTVADLIHVRVHLVAAADLVGRGKSVVLRENGAVCMDRHFTLQRFHFPLHGKQLAVGRAQNVLDGIARRVDGDLGNQADFAVRRKDDRAVVRLQLPGEHTKQGGLAAAVAAHDAHALPRQDLKSEPVQKNLSDLKGFF